MASLVVQLRGSAETGPSRMSVLHIGVAEPDNTLVGGAVRSLSTYFLASRRETRTEGGAAKLQAGRTRGRPMSGVIGQADVAAADQSARF